MSAPVVTISGHPLVSPFLVKCDNPCVISADVTGHPVPTVTWYIDCGEKVVEGPRFHIERQCDGRKHSLTIRNIDEYFDKRLLTIYAVNIHGCDTSMIDLKTFTVYPRYRAPDIRRIPETLRSSGSVMADSSRRRTTRPRRQCHSVPRSLDLASNHLSHDKTDIIRSQTYKAAPKVKEPATIVRSVSLKPSRRVDSNHSYDSGIGDIVRPSVSACLPSDSVDNVFVHFRKVPTKTTFGESYELCPDDTPLFVDIPYSRPLYFPVSAAEDAKRDRDAASDTQHGIQSFSGPRKASIGLPSKDSESAGAAHVVKSRGPFEVPLRRTVDSGCADLGQNVWLMAGKRRSQVCSEILAYQPKETLRTLKDRSEEKSRRKSSVTDKKDIIKRQNNDKMHKSDKQISIPDDTGLEKNSATFPPSEMQAAVDGSEVWLINHSDRSFTGKRSDTNKAKVPTEDHQKRDSDSKTAEHSQLKPSTVSLRSRVEAAEVTKHILGRETTPKIKQLLAEGRRSKQSIVKTINSQALAVDSTRKTQSPKTEEYSGPIQKRSTSEHRKNSELPDTSFKHKNISNFEVDIKANDAYNDRSCFTANESPQCLVYTGRLKEYSNYSKGVDISKNVVEEDNKKNQRPPADTYRETVKATELTESAKSEACRTTLDMTKSFPSESDPVLPDTSRLEVKINNASEHPISKQICPNHDQEEGRATRKIFITERVIIRSRIRTGANNGNSFNRSNVGCFTSKAKQALENSNSSVNYDSAERDRMADVGGTDRGNRQMSISSSGGTIRNIGKLSSKRPEGFIEDISSESKDIAYYDENDGKSNRSDQRRSRREESDTPVEDELSASRFEEQSSKNEQYSAKDGGKRKSVDYPSEQGRHISVRNQKDNNDDSIAMKFSSVKKNENQKADESLTCNVNDAKIVTRKNTDKEQSCVGSNKDEKIAVTLDEGTMIDEKPTFIMKDNQGNIPFEGDDGTMINGRDVSIGNNDQGTIANEEVESAIIDGLYIHTRNNVQEVFDCEKEIYTREENARNNVEEEETVNEEIQKTNDEMNTCGIRDHVTVNEDKNMCLINDSADGSDQMQQTNGIEGIYEGYHEEEIHEADNKVQTMQLSTVASVKQTFDTSEPHQQGADLNNCSEVREPENGQRIWSKNSADEYTSGEWILDIGNPSGIDEMAVTSEMRFVKWSVTSEPASKPNALQGTKKINEFEKKTALVDNVSQSDICIGQMKVAEGDSDEIRKVAVNEGTIEQSNWIGIVDYSNTLDVSEIGDNSINGTNLTTDRLTSLTRHNENVLCQKDSEVSPLVRNDKTPPIAKDIKISSSEKDSANKPSSEETETYLFQGDGRILSLGKIDDISSQLNNSCTFALRNISESSALKKADTLSSFATDEEILSATKYAEIFTQKNADMISSPCDDNVISSLEKSGPISSRANDNTISLFAENKTGSSENAISTPEKLTGETDLIDDGPVTPATVFEFSERTFFSEDLVELTIPARRSSIEGFNNMKLLPVTDGVSFREISVQPMSIVFDEQAIEHVKNERIYTENVDEHLNYEDVYNEHAGEQEKNKDVSSKLTGDQVNYKNCCTGHVGEHVNYEGTYTGQAGEEHSGEEQKHKDVSSELTDEQVNYEDVYNEHAGEEEKHEDVSSELKDEQLNYKDVYNEHAGEEEKHEDVSSELTDEQLNYEDVYNEHVGDEEKREDVSSELTDEQVKYEDVYNEHAGEEEKHVSSKLRDVCTGHADEQINSGDFYKDHAGEQDKNEDVSSELIDEQMNWEDVYNEQAGEEEKIEGAFSELTGEQVNYEDLYIKHANEQVENADAEHISEQGKTEDILVNQTGNTEEIEDVYTEQIGEQAKNEDVCTEHRGEQQKIKEVYSIQMSEHKKNEDVRTEQVGEPEKNKVACTEQTSEREKNEDVYTELMCEEVKNYDALTQQKSKEQKNKNFYNEQMYDQENDLGIDTEEIGERSEGKGVYIEGIRAEDKNNGVTSGQLVEHDANGDVLSEQINEEDVNADFYSEQIDEQGKNEHIRTKEIDEEEKNEYVRTEEIDEQDTDGICSEQMRDRRESKNIDKEQMDFQEKNKEFRTDKTGEEGKTEGLCTRRIDEEEKNYMFAKQTSERDRYEGVFTDQRDEQKKTDVSFELKSSDVMLSGEIQVIGSNEDIISSSGCDVDISSSDNLDESSSSKQTGKISLPEFTDEIPLFDKTDEMPLSEKIDLIPLSEETADFCLHRQTLVISLFEKTSEISSSEKTGEISSVEKTGQISSYEKSYDISSTEADEVSKDSPWHMERYEQANDVMLFCAIENKRTHDEKCKDVSFEIQCEKRRDLVSSQNIADDTLKIYEAFDSKALSETGKTNRNIFSESPCVPQMIGDNVRDSKIDIFSSLEVESPTTCAFISSELSAKSETANKMRKENYNCAEFVHPTSGAKNVEEQTTKAFAPAVDSPCDSGFFSLNTAALSLIATSGQDAKDIDGDSSAKLVTLEVDNQHGPTTLLMDCYSGTDFDDALPVSGGATPFGVVDSNDSPSLRSDPATDSASTDRDSELVGSVALLNSLGTFIPDASSGWQQSRLFRDHSNHGFLTMYRPDKMSNGEDHLFSNVRFSTKSADPMATSEYCFHQSNADRQDRYFSSSLPDGDSLRRGFTANIAEPESGKDDDKEPETPSDNRTIYIVGAVAGALVAGLLAYATIRHLRLNVNKDGPS